MKKFLILALFFVILSPFAIASDWFEIFEKQYIDFSSIQISPQTKTIKFWVKKLRTNPKEKFLGIDYWYAMNKWSISCSTRQSRIESVTIYDLKKQVIYSDDTIPEWNEIVPDTYAEGYYKILCSRIFNKRN